MKHYFAIRISTALFLCLSVLISCGGGSSGGSGDSFEVNPGRFVSGGASVEFIGEHPNGYFNVIFDYQTSGDSPREMGANYAIALQNAVTGVEEYYAQLIESRADYNTIIYRASILKEYVYEDYREEIEGFASQFGGGAADERDGKLSLNEIFVCNVTVTSGGGGCSAVAVYGNRTETGNTISAHLYDWDVPRSTRAVFTIKNGDKSVLFIASALTLTDRIVGINDDGLFYGALASPTDAPFYPDIENNVYPGGESRYALENFSTIDGFTDYMLSINHVRARFNYIISDRNESKILEYNEGVMCALRSDDSQLNPGLEWGFEDAVAVVNAFMLYGNTNNFLFNPQWGLTTYNELRWNAYRSQLGILGPIVTFDEVREMATYHANDQNYTYHEGTRQIVVFDASDFWLAIYARNGRAFTLNPEFFELPVSFD